MKIKTFYCVELDELEEIINIEVDKLKEKDMYIYDIDIKVIGGQYNQYIGIIKFRENEEEKIQWFNLD